jgi:SAM-dependent methyltransferase
MCHIDRNRQFWDTDADAYQAAHGEALATAPLAWGAYRVPESELQVLGDVRSRDVLELGCGAAQWSMSLAALGTQIVGLDLSTSQLAYARTAAPKLPLVLANGERLPFARERFDVVFCDHGALSFCEPELIVPECARVLRPGGLLAFCATHPLLYLTWDEKQQRQTRKLQIDYHQLGRMEEETGTINWALPPGGWLRILTRNGFVVEDLIELCAGSNVATTYEEFAPPKWARRWPAEWIWRARLV